jgi:hypothetical protein
MCFGVNANGVKTVKPATERCLLVLWNKNYSWGDPDTATTSRFLSVPGFFLKPNANFSSLEKFAVKVKLIGNESKESSITK